MLALRGYGPTSLKSCNIARSKNGYDYSIPKTRCCCRLGINAETIRRARMMGGEIYDPAEGNGRRRELRNQIFVDATST